MTVSAAPTLEKLHRELARLWTLPSARPGALSLSEYDMLAAASGLSLVNRWSTWDRVPFTTDEYAVSLHERGPDTLG